MRALAALAALALAGCASGRGISVAPAVAPVPVAAIGHVYRLSGDRLLWPVAMQDDGARTFITWASDQPLPAVFALNDLGHEEMVDGYMRGGVFVIDRLYGAFIFRIDRAEAAARRMSDAGAPR